MIFAPGSFYCTENGLPHPDGPLLPGLAIRAGNFCCLFIWAFLSGPLYLGLLIWASLSGPPYLGLVIWASLFGRHPVVEPPLPALGDPCGPPMLGQLCFGVAVDGFEDDGLEDDADDGEDDEDPGEVAGTVVVLPPVAALATA